MRGKDWLSLIVGIALVATLTMSPSLVLAQGETGWAISPGEVRVDGILLGESTTFPITIVNNKDFPLSFSMSVNLPDPSRLRPGYELIPDTSWISFSPRHIELAPDSREKITVTVTIPSEGDWGGKNYECWFDATSERIGMLQVVLSCRLLLSTSAAYAPGINWPLVGGIIGGIAIVGGLIYGNRRRL